MRSEPTCGRLIAFILRQCEISTEIFQTCRLQHLDAIDYLTGIMPALIAGDVDPLRLTPAIYAARHRVA